MTATGKTYGDALYDLAAEEAICDELLEQVKLLARLFRENPQYPALLTSPDIPREERLHLIGEALTGQVHPYLVNFLCLLCERGRLPAFAGCAARYEQRWLEDHNTVRGRVSSAVPLTETQLTVLAARMGETLGKHVLLEGTVSPSLIGGIRVEIDGRVWDGSLRGRLEELSGLSGLDMIVLSPYDSGELQLRLEALRSRGNTVRLYVMEGGAA